MMNQQRMPARPALRRGFTLVELLVAVVIIGIIAGMVLYTIAGAQRDAKEAKTKATIRKLNSVILQKFEEYKYRSVKINIPKYYTQRNFGMTSAMTTEQAPPLLLAKEMARVRAIVLKDYMRMEMPDQQLDLFCVPTRVNNISLTNGTTVTLDDFGGRYCAPEYNLLRRYFNVISISEPVTGMVASAYSNRSMEVTTAIDASRTWTQEWESAECLYAIVAHSVIDGASAMEGFHATEIGDIDGDSFPEFHDAWGKPIGWVRWPAGFPSILNLNYKSADPDPSRTGPLVPDAFDPYKTDPQFSSAQHPWTLVPLIVSAGPDGKFGLDDSAIPEFAGTQNAYAPSTTAPSAAQVIDSAAAADNITSHDLLLE